MTPVRAAGSASRTGRPAQAGRPAGEATGWETLQWRTARRRHYQDGTRPGTERRYSYVPFGAHLQSTAVFAHRPPVTSARTAVAVVRATPGAQQLIGDARFIGPLLDPIQAWCGRCGRLGSGRPGPAFAGLDCPSSRSAGSRRFICVPGRVRFPPLLPPTRCDRNKSARSAALAC
jgi:hypothetical protein